MAWHDLALLPLGILAGLLSGLLGIGGGLIFSPLLLLHGLPPHEALATSTLAIVPTTLTSSWTHLRSHQLSRPSVLAIAAGAMAGGILFSHLGTVASGWQLMGLQALMYAGLTVLETPHSHLEDGEDRPEPPAVGLAAIGTVAGCASGLVGVGGGLVMVPLMVRGLGVRIHRAIRLSTLAVCVSAMAASPTFLGDGRGHLGMALGLGGTAALASAWSARRLQQVSEAQLVWMLRLLTLALALYSGRRALALLQATGATAG